MTVRELIEKLGRLPQNVPIYMAVLGYDMDSTHEEIRSMYNPYDDKWILSDVSEAKRDGTDDRHVSATESGQGRQEEGRR